jgi:hypothetical protein
VAEIVKGSMKQAEDAILDAFQGGTDGARAFFAYVAEQLARMAIRNFILAPISNWMSGLFGGGADVRVAHGGMVAGVAGGTTRHVDPLIFAGAPRYHSGGMVGLQPDEVPAILQRGERVLSRAEVARGGGDAGATMTINIAGANGDQHLIDLVQQGISAGLQAYDRALPGRISRIQRNPRLV